MWTIPIVTAVGLVIIVACHLIMRKKMDLKEHIQLASTLVTTLTTVVLAFFSWQQMSDAKRSQQVIRSTEWSELKSAMWDIMDLLSHPAGTSSMVMGMQVEERMEFANRTRRLLDSQSGNARLIENEQCLGHWRNAISSARTISSIYRASGVTNADEIVVANFNTIARDVGFVWNKLVLQSGEVSAVGGLPATE